MKIIVNNSKNEYCIYEDRADAFDNIVILLKERYGKDNIHVYEATFNSLTEDFKIEEIRGNKKVLLAEWL